MRVSDTTKNLLHDIALEYEFTMTDQERQGVLLWFIFNGTLIFHDKKNVYQKYIIVLYILSVYFIIYPAKREFL